MTEANPLYITLTTKYRFSSRLAFLVKAAEDGLGLSQLDSCRDEELENSSVADENALTNNVGTSGDDNNFDGLSDSQRHTEDQKVNGGQETHTIEAGQPTRREDGVFDGSASAQSTVDQNAAAATNDANEEIDTAVGDRSSIKAGFEQSPAGAAQRQDYQSSDLIDYGDTDEIQAPEEAAKVDHGSSASSTARGDGDSENTSRSIPHFPYVRANLASQSHQIGALLNPHRWPLLIRKSLNLMVEKMTRLNLTFSMTTCSQAILVFVRLLTTSMIMPRLLLKLWKTLTKHAMHKI